VTGDPTAWHKDKQVVRLCALLTWLLALPCLIRVVVQAPIWFAAKSGTMDADSAIAALGVLKIAMGWPLQLAALGAMAWVLARNKTPVESTASA
jgi:small-conductance mechanosensitive channel